MSLSENIHEDSRHKERAKRKLKSNGQKIDEKSVGKASSVHNKFCSCFACGNPRKHFKDKTLQEKKAYLDQDV